MTVCLGAKLLDADGNVKAVRVATDSQVSLGQTKMIGISKSCAKGVAFPGAFIACSGSGIVFEALALLQEDKEYYNKVQFRTREDIRSFARDFFEQYKSLLEESLCSEGDAQMGVLLIATNDELYSVYSDLSIFTFDYWNSSGSGASTAHALMMAYYDELGPDSTEEDLERILNRVMEKTCEIEEGCSGPIVIYTPQEPNPLLIKKSRKKKLTNKPSDDKIAAGDVPEVRNDKKRRAK